MSGATNDPGVPTLAELITEQKTRRGYSYRRLEARADSVISAQRWQQLGSGVRIKEFPEPATLQAMADALEVDVASVVLAAARSIGLPVKRRAESDLALMLPASAALLTSEQRDAILMLVRSITRGATDAQPEPARPADPPPAARAPGAPAEGKKTELIAAELLRRHHSPERGSAPADGTWVFVVPLVPDRLRTEVPAKPESVRARYLADADRRRRESQQYGRYLPTVADSSDDVRVLIRDLVLYQMGDERVALDEAIWGRVTAFAQTIKVTLDSRGSQLGLPYRDVEAEILEHIRWPDGSAVVDDVEARARQWWQQAGALEQNWSLYRDMSAWISDPPPDEWPDGEPVTDQTREQFHGWVMNGRPLDGWPTWRGDQPDELDLAMRRGIDMSLGRRLRQQQDRDAENGGS